MSAKSFELTPRSPSEHTLAVHVTPDCCAATERKAGRFSVMRTLVAASGPLLVIVIDWPAIVSPTTPERVGFVSRATRSALPIAAYAMAAGNANDAMSETQTATDRAIR